MYRYIPTLFIQIYLCAELYDYSITKDFPKMLRKIFGITLYI